LLVSAPSQLLTIARKAAAAQALDPALVCAVVEQESAWNPWAMRYEPAFFTKYVASLYTNNKVSASEAYARGFSWGFKSPVNPASMPCFSLRYATRSKASPSAAKSCEKSSTSSGPTLPGRSSPGTAAPTLSTQFKFSLAALIICESYMFSKLWLHLATLTLLLALGVALFLSWRADLRDRVQLASELAATKQLVTAADARQHDRDTQLQKTLATLATERRTVATPTQIVKDLPTVIPLPVPITLQTPPPASTAPNVPKPNAPGAIIPPQDLKPLYDFSLDCQACRAKLSAARGNPADEQTKTAPSPKNATTLCASPKAEVFSAASPAPPNGSP
jgi:hypothetical protein